MKKFINFITHRDFLFGTLVLFQALMIFRNLSDRNLNSAFSDLVSLVYIVACWLILATYERKRNVCDQQKLLIDELYSLLELHKRMKRTLEAKIEALEAAFSKEKKETYTKAKNKTAGN